MSITIESHNQNNNMGIIIDLTHAFLDELQQRKPEISELVDRYRDYIQTEYTDNIANYSIPKGGLYLASDNSEAIGTVCFHSLTDEICEISRLFVKPEYRRLKTGYALVNNAINEAKLYNFKFMRLGTAKWQTGSYELYQDLGFYYIKPYQDVSRKLKDDLLWMELNL